MSLKNVMYRFHSEEQDSADAVLLLFLLLLPFGAALPHAHLCAAGFSLSLFLFAFFQKKKTKSLQISHFSTAFLLALAATASGLLLAESRAHTLLSLVLRLSYFVPILLDGHKEPLRRAIVLSGAVQGAIALVERAFPKLFPVGTGGWTDASRFSSFFRAGGLFGNPNTLAVFLLPSFLLALYGTLFLQRRKELFPLFLSGLGLLCTGSRGAWCAAAVSTFFLLWRRYGGVLCLTVLFSLLPLLSLLLPEGLLLRAASVFSPDSSVRYRFSLWKSFTRLPPDTLLFGVGEGKAAMLHLLSPVLAAGLIKLEHTHSLFLHLLTADGLLGLLLYLCVFSLSILRGRKNGTSLPFLSLLLFGFFDDPLYNGQTEVLFWLCASLF